MRLSPCVLVQPDGWARGEREGYGDPCDVTSLSLSLETASPIDTLFPVLVTRPGPPHLPPPAAGGEIAEAEIRGARAQCRR